MEDDNKKKVRVLVKVVLAYLVSLNDIYNNVMLHAKTGFTQTLAYFFLISCLKSIFNFKTKKKIFHES